MAIWLVEKMVPKAANMTSQWRRTAAVTTAGSVTALEKFPPRHSRAKC